MAIAEINPAAWTRKHDSTSAPIRQNPERVVCFDSWEDLVEICQTRPAGKRMKAAGSHWALSEAALADHHFIETNWPIRSDAVPRNSGLAEDFGSFISDAWFNYLANTPPARAEARTTDPCLESGGRGHFFVHIKSGTRVYEAYSLLDGGHADSALLTANGSLARRLNERLGVAEPGPYSGPWAFQTLGGAGGQTVFGALTTGTHGGDFRQRPISDSVAALHLVADGGDHYWIEPRDNRAETPISDDARLKAYYETIQGVNFTIKRDNDLFDAVMVGAGRFGVVASLVLRVVPQYCLLEHRVLDNWSSVKAMLKGSGHHAFSGAYFPVSGSAAAFAARFGVNPASIENRFLQIAINVCPHLWGEHRCGITQRWFVPHSFPEALASDGVPQGRRERGASATAGNTHSYEPPEAPGEHGSSSGTFIQKVCSNPNFLAGVVEVVGDEIQTIIEDGAVPVAGVGVGSLLVGGGTGLLNLGASLCAVLAAALLAVRAVQAALEELGDASLAQVAHVLITGILNNPAIPRELGLMIIRTILLELFESEQGPRNFVALSYAVMDTHDYKDRSCYGNAESIEVFFDAGRPDVYCSYLDQVLAFEGAQQENHGRVMIGYVSLRYVRQSYALLAPSRYPETVVMEIAGIRDASGTMPFIENAIRVARHPAFGVPFHWGQLNPLNRLEVERIYNGSPRPGDLDRWRAALLSVLPADRRGFSNQFTRGTGLEA